MASTCVIWTKRADVRDAVRQELKALKVDQAVIPKDPDACVEALIQMPQAILVIDWDVGAAEANLVLEAVRSHFKIETRPIFMIVADIDESLVAIGAEFGVSQMHAGPVSRESLRAGLAEMLHEDETTRAVRETLVQVAMARAKKQWTAATQVLRQLNDQVPNQERVVVELAENLIQEDAWDEARRLLEPLTQLTPPNIRALHLMGRCQMHAHDFDAAVGLLARAKVINPHNVERLIDLGEACLKADRLDEAMASFNDALALDSDCKAAKVGVGKVQLLTGEVNEALALLKSISGPRELASVFNTAAILSMRQERYPEGMKLYQAATKALGRDDHIAARLVFNMGLGYRRWQKVDKALTCFNKALELDPAFAKAAKYRDSTKKMVGKAAPDIDERIFDEEDLTAGGGPAKSAARASIGGADDFPEASLPGLTDDDGGDA